MTRPPRIRTSTRDPLLRLLYVAVALILRNVWVWLHWEVLSGTRRGGRVLRLEALTVKALLLMLLQVAEELLGMIGAARTGRPIPGRLVT